MSPKQEVKVAVDDAEVGRFVGTWAGKQGLMDGGSGQQHS